MEEVVCISVIDRIKTARKAARLSQAALAQAVGLSANFIALVETGARQPGDRTIRDICGVLGLSEAWLRTGEGAMYVARTREEEMADEVARLMASAPDSFKAALISALLRFDTDGPEREVVERIYRSVEKELDR